jgi:hypothetical protein
MVIEDLLQRHLAVQLGVQGDEDGAQPATRVEPEDAEALAIGGDGADSVARRVVGVGIGAGGELGDGAVNRRIAEGGERLAGRTPCVERGEALLGGAAVPLQVQADHSLDAGELIGIEVTARDQEVGDGAGLVQRPGLEGSH